MSVAGSWLGFGGVNGSDVESEYVELIEPLVFARGPLSDTTFEASSISFTIRALFVTYETNRSFICVLFQPCSATAWAD